MKEYIVVYEWAGSNWSAYSPDVPGCIAVGDTRDEVERNYKEALEIYADEMKTRGLSLPEPHADDGRVAVAV